MKSTDRHKLKGNEFAQTVARARDVAEARKQELTLGLTVAVIVIVIGGGYFTYRNLRESKATTLLASALAVAEAPVVTPPPPAPGSPPPVQPAGTFRTERERLDASVPKLQAAADAYPNTEAGITARFRLAATLAELGRHAEAQQRYQEVAAKTGRKDIYHHTARLGVGEAQLAQGKAADAMATFQELAGDSDSQLPLDGVLMQLARAAMAAGKKVDAARAFTRVVDEFPQSLYASEAKEKLSELKKA